MKTEVRHMLINVHDANGYHFQKETLILNPEGFADETEIINTICDSYEAIGLEVDNIGESKNWWHVSRPQIKKWEEMNNELL